MTDANRIAYKFYLECVNEINIKSGLLKEMVQEFEFSQAYRNEFMRKLYMIDNAVKKIAWLKSLKKK